MRSARFTKVAYSDASFAVGETKQSITGFIILINGTPVLCGSLKQTVVVDSTLLISLMLRTNYVIRVMRIKDKGDIDKFK